MQTIDKAIVLSFGLLFALLFAVYYIGLTTDVNAVGGVVGNLAQIFTGRNPKTGAFQNYPGGA